MPNFLVSESAMKKLKTPRRAGAYERLCMLQRPAVQRQRLWESMFGRQADFLPRRQMSAYDPSRQELTGVPEGECFVVTHLTIQWMEMENEAGPFGTNQKTY